MRNIEDNIDIFIAQQVPLFYNEYGPQFIEFIKQYYVWLQSTGKPIQVARELLDYRDIDLTTDTYLKKFEKKYLVDIPSGTEASRRRFLKNALDLYRNKGNEKSYDVLFRALYNEDIKIYTPGQDMLRLSDGEWYQPAYIEVSFVDNIGDYVNKEIVGIGSGAKAIVEHYQQIIVQNKTIEVLILSNVRGFFIRGEYVRQIDQPTQIENLPKIIGSLSGLSIINGGANFTVGDTLLVSGKGKQAKARVAETTSLDGKVTFTLELPGSGYSLDTIPIVQSRIRLNTTSANNNIQPGQLLYQDDNIANGYVFSVSNTEVIVKEVTSGWDTGASFKTALIMEIFKTGPFVNSFSQGEIITQYNESNNQIANGIISTITSGNTSFVITDVQGEFVISAYSNTGNVVNYVRSSNTYVNGFISSIIGGANTGSGIIQDIDGGGSGASFRIGGLYDIEEIVVNTDYIRDYLTETITYFDESNPQTGNVDVTINQSNVVGTSTTFTTTYTSNSYIQIGTGANKQVRQITSITNNTLLTVDTVFNASRTSNSHFKDEADYGFPKSSSVENINTILSSALTLEVEEVGSIAYLRAITPGSGYRLNPFVTLTNGDVAALAIEDFINGGIKGNNALVNAAAGFADGIVSSVELIDSGYGFEPGEYVTMEKEGSPFAVSGRAIVQTQGKGTGYWRNTRGFLSADKFIQDSKYYQEYSYEIQSSLNTSKYNSVVKNILHPIGTEMFGKVSIVSEQLNDLSQLSLTEIELPATGTVTANTTSNTITGTSTTFTTLFSNGDLIKIDNYTRLVTNVSNNTILQIDTPFSNSFVSNTFSKIVTG